MTGEKDPRDVMQAEHDARLSEHPAFRAPAEMPGVEDIARVLFEFATCTDIAKGPAAVDANAGSFARAILALFAPILAEKERERDEARADLAKLMDPELKHLRIEGGAVDLALTGPIVQHMGLVISEHFRASGAENYIEMTYHAKTEPFETYVWTIQKRVGSNSPHDLRAAAEARALAAEAALAAERERVEQLHATIRKAHVAMTMACALPGVAAEYDFSEAIASTEATLARRATAIRAQGE